MATAETDVMDVLRERGAPPTSESQRAASPRATAKARQQLPLPEDVPQHLRHLELANQVRLARAGLKRQLRACASYDEARCRASEFLLDAKLAPVLAGMPVVQLLGGCRRMGPWTARRILTALSIGELRKIGELTPRQHNDLAAYLRGDQVSGVCLPGVRLLADVTGAAA